MLYKFKSKAAGDVIMLEPNGRQVLAIIGKDNGRDYGAQGILQPAQMKAAATALTAAIGAEELAQKEAVAKAVADGKPAPKFDGVSLRQRAHPMLEILKSSEKAGVDVVWGV